MSPGTIPAYSVANTYSFVIDVPNPTATPLTFGVNDGNYSDNGGSYTITVTRLAVPEPSAVAGLALGLLGLGAFGLRARRRRARLTA